MKKIGLIVMAFLGISSAVYAGPIFPTRGYLMHPRWFGKTDSTAMLEHSGFYADVQRGFGSDSDRWGWSITMGGIVEFSRWGGNKSLFAFSNTELLSDTHNDIGFNPHAAHWEEGLMYAVHENPQFDWQLGTVYRCRHDVDNGDPNQYNGLGTQRTLIYCSLSGKAILHSEEFLNWRIPTDVWVRADGYLIREDYRLPYSDNGIGTDFNNLAWTLGLGEQLKLWKFSNSAVYWYSTENFTAFGKEPGFIKRFNAIDRLAVDVHLEAGYEFNGRSARFQIYGGWERWDDDGQTPIPRDTQFALLGFRFTGLDFAR